MGHLNDLMKRLKSQDATLFRPSGRTLKQGTEFPHDFNSEHMTNIEGKHLRLISRELKANTSQREEREKKTDARQTPARGSASRKTLLGYMISVS